MGGAGRSGGGRDDAPETQPAARIVQRRYSQRDSISPSPSSSTPPTNMMSSQPVVVDGKGALLGRLASVLAKQILNGQKITVVRCEDINVSGGFFRNKVSIRGGKIRVVLRNEASIVGGQQVTRQGRERSWSDCRAKCRRKDGCLQENRQGRGRRQQTTEPATVWSFDGSEGKMLRTMMLVLERARSDAGSTTNVDDGRQTLDRSIRSVRSDRTLRHLR